MKKFLFALLCFSFLLFASCGTGDWHVYKADEFTVEFPGLAKDTATMEGELAGAKAYFEPVEGSLDSNLYYAVSFYSLPDSISVLQEDLKNVFTGDVKIYAFTMNGTLSDSGRAVKSGNYEGMEYKVFLAHSAGTATVRKFAKGKRLYTLLVVTEQSCIDNTQIERFMESFKLK